MNLKDKVKAYTDKLCEQIRWKKAHKEIVQEFSDHIMDQYYACLEEGLDEKTALDKAVDEMGDPVLVGGQLNRIYRPKMDWPILGLTIILLLTGLGINYYVQFSLFEIRPSYPAGIGVFVGIIGLVTAYLIDFSVIGRYPKVIYITLAVFLCFAVGCENIIHSPNVDLSAGFFSALEMLLSITYAGVLYDMRGRGYSGIILSGAFCVFPASLLILLGESIAVITLWSAVCFILLNYVIYKGWFKVKKRIGYLIVWLPAVVSGIVLLLHRPYYTQRLKAILNPLSDLYGAGYLPNMIREIIGGARLAGEGIIPPDLSSTLSQWLPNANTDYLLTVLIHKVGWISLIIILTLFLIFFIRGFYLWRNHRSVLGRLVSLAVLLNLLFQTLIYISANMGYPFMAQQSLPLFSQGFMLIINLIQFGILLSVFKSGSLSLGDNSMPQRENRLVRIIDGKVIINLKTFN